MRREKPRHQRRRFRPVLTLSLATLILIVLCFGHELWFAYSITPQIQKNYGGMIRETAESWQDTTGVNGWDHLVEAIRLHDEHVNKYTFVALDKHWSGGTWEYDTIIQPEDTRELVRDVYGPENSDAYFEAMRGWASETIDQFVSLGIQAQLNHLAESGYVLRPIDDSVIGVAPESFQSHGSLRSLAKCLHARMVLSRANADWDLYVHSYHSLILIGNSLALQPGMVSTLVANAVRSTAMDQVIDDLQLGVIPDKTILQLYEDSSFWQEGPSLGELLHLDRLAQMDFFQRFFGRGGRLILTEYAKLVPFTEKEHWIFNVQGLWKPRWGHYENLIDVHYDEMIRIVKLPFAEREPLRRESKPRSLVARITDPKEDEEPLRAFDPTKSFAERFMSEDAAFTLADQRIVSVSLRDGLHLLLAIEAHRIATGDYPVTLDELVLQFVENPPIDPCSIAGDPWIYRRLDAPDTGGRSFLLYAVGFDMQDNGGARPSGYLTQPLSRHNAGTDFVVSHPPLPETAAE